MPLFKNPHVVKAEEGILNTTEDQLKNYTPQELFALAPYDEKEGEKTASSNYSYWRSTLYAFSKNKVAMFLLILIVAILLFTFIQPYLPNQFDPFVSNNDPATGLPYRNVAPGATFWMGTNSIGQDLWARVWAGTRTSLTIGFSVAIIEAFVGILVGVLWGYIRKLDFLFTEIYNVVDNIPSTIVLILVSLILRPGMSTMIFAMCLTGWIGMARFVRNQILIIRDRDYNIASRCLGTSPWRIIMRNLLPYLVSVIMLRMALAVPAAIGSEVFITYVGLGLPATIPSLGALINAGRQLMLSPNLRYQLIYPTLILSIVTVSFYVIGNAFADAADPKNHR